MFTIRAKILAAFLSLTAITGALGIGAIHGAIESSRLVVHTYDEPLQTIGKARRAEADFANMRLELAHREAATTLAERQAIDRRFVTLSRATMQDLADARDHAESERAAGIAQQALEEFDTWNTLRRQSIDSGESAGFRETMHAHAAALVGKLQALLEVTLDDCAHDRARTIGSIYHYQVWSIVTTAAALVLGTLIALALARHMGRPIAEASRAAGRIAAGDLDVDITPSGRDELGQLLTAMSAMRNNIRAMMERERAARRSAQGRLVSAVEGLHEGIALVGADNRLLLANAQFADFFPSHADELVAGGTLPMEAEIALASPTGEIRLADGRWLRLRKSERTDGGYVATASDISLLKEREAVLHAAKEQAEAANRAKTEFLTNMSHELRTPLTAIIGFSEIIATESFGPIGQAKYREFADDILHSGRHLLDVINDMLDIAKLQSGMTELRLQQVPARGIIDSAVRIVRKKAEQAGVGLELLLPSEMPTIHVDHVRMRQVLLNLLSNAIKFTPAGGRVSILAERREAGLAIIVRDTGIGMAPEDIPRALQPFVQVDNSLARRHGGTGLGLPLSKLFVDLHGGQFSIRSAPGKGTSVTILLPAPSYVEREMYVGEVAA